MKNILNLIGIKLLSAAFALFTMGILKAQIGIGIANPSASAQLDVNSTSKGFLPPRMTQVQRNAIVSPATGLIIWCKDCGLLGELQVYNHLTWTNLTGGPTAADISSTTTVFAQTWMTRNLNVSSYRNGEPIPEVKDPVVWANLTTGAWCYYNNDSILGAIYGKLYNYAAVVDPRGLAPAGWHIPPDSVRVLQDNMSYADGDWIPLLRNLGGEVITGWHGIIKGGLWVAAQMKAISIWNNNGLQPNNLSGFTGLPAGQRNADGSFSSLGIIGRWWSSGKYSNYIGSTYGNEDYYHVAFTLDANGFNFDPVLYSTYFFGPQLPPGHDIPYGVYYPAGYGFSVRCVKD
jgi:uncharacterized protein (TIGR02145 family)